MKDFTKETYMESRPQISTAETLDFCLRQIFADKTKVCSDEVVHGLTYEELIGTLLLARDAVFRLDGLEY